MLGALGKFLLCAVAGHGSANIIAPDLKSEVTAATKSIALTFVNDTDRFEIDQKIDDLLNRSTGWSVTPHGVVLFRSDDTRVSYYQGKILSLELDLGWMLPKRADGVRERQVLIDQAADLDWERILDFDLEPGWEVMARELGSPYLMVPGVQRAAWERIQYLDDSQMPVRWRNTEVLAMELSLICGRFPLLNHGGVVVAIDRHSYCIVGLRGRFKELPAVVSNTAAFPKMSGEGRRFLPSLSAVMRFDDFWISAIGLGDRFGLMVPKSRSPYKRFSLEERALADANKAIVVHRVSVRARGRDGKNHELTVYLSGETKEPLTVIEHRIPFFADPTIQYFGGAGPDPKYEWVKLPEACGWRVLGSLDDEPGWLVPVESSSRAFTRKASIVALDGQMRIVTGTKDFEFVKVRGDKRVFKPNDTLRKALQKAKVDLSPFGDQKGA
jgi:hypothetical protein